MNKSTLAVAVAVGLLAQQAGAAGFIEDSKATLKLRNFYINTDNRDSGTKAAGAQNKQEEWGQGFQLDYTSGFTQGTVGFGVDAIALLGVRLDSGGGTNGVGSYGGTVFPSKSNGDAVNEYSSLGLTAKAKISQTELRYGTLMPKLPVISYNDGRLLPQTFEGGQITSNEFKDLTLIGGQIEHVKGRNSSNNEQMSIGGRTLAPPTATSSSTPVATTRSPKTCCFSTTTATWTSSTNRTSWAWYTTGRSALVY